MAARCRDRPRRGSALTYAGFDICDPCVRRRPSPPIPWPEDDAAGNERPNRRGRTSPDTSNTTCRIVLISGLQRIVRMPARWSPAPARRRVCVPDHALAACTIGTPGKRQRRPVSARHDARQLAPSEPSLGTDDGAAVFAAPRAAHFLPRPASDPALSQH